METARLFRPVGDEELRLVEEGGWKQFPPRLPEQPIFYPVLEEAYAVQIARDWNTRDGAKGHVLRFDVDSEFLSKYPIQIAGARIHKEYWIPAEELAEFNRHIVGVIELIHTFSK